MTSQKIPMAIGADALHAVAQPDLYGVDFPQFVGGVEVHPAVGVAPVVQRRR
jgi:hypothetical protein